MPWDWGSRLHGRASLLALLLSITLIKLALAGVWGWSMDIDNTLQHARALLAIEGFHDPRIMQLSPLWGYIPIGHYLIAVVCLLLSQATGLAFSFWIKTPAILTDLGVALLLWTMPRGGNRVAMFYMLNPVTFLLSVYHGQTHTVGLGAAVFALWLADRSYFELSGLLLGLAASIRQHYAALILPLVTTAGRSRYVTLGLFALILLLASAPLFGRAPPERLLMPPWTYGSWGYTMLLRQGPRVLALVGVHQIGVVFDVLNRVLQTYGFLLYLLWAGIFGIWVWQRRQKDLWQVALFFLIGMYVISPGFGVQWLVWAVPFWFIVNPWEALGYSGLAGGLLATSYFWQWGLNAKYGVVSVTANLHLLSLVDLIGVLMVGVFGFLTWAFCVRAAWRLARK